MKTVRNGFFGEDVEVRKHPQLDVLVSKSGFIVRKLKSRKGEPVSFGYGERDYLYIKIAGVNHPVHTLVAETFLGSPGGTKTVDHINRVKTDNRVCNLRWADPKEQADNRDFVIKRHQASVRACDDRVTYVRERRAYVREHGQGYGYHTVIDDEAHRLSRERNARYRQKHKAEIKARNHELYLRRKAKNESR